MIARRIERRRKARDDIGSALDVYLANASVDVARRFVDEIDEALLLLAEYPQAGSSQHASSTGLPGLRSWPLRRFPYLIFYFDRGDHIEVWRVLHGRRDLSKILEEGD